MQKLMRRVLAVCMCAAIGCYVVSSLTSYTPLRSGLSKRQGPLPAGSDAAISSKTMENPSFSKTMINISFPFREQWEHHLPPSPPRLPWCHKFASPGGQFLKKVYSDTKSSRLLECINMRRVGASGDGGKMICLDDIRPGCVVYSLGSRLDFSFEVDMLKVLGNLGCTVHTFDCTVGTPPADKVPKGVHFHPWCVGGADEVKKISSDLGHDGEQGQYFSLSTIMKQLNHSSVDLLKMDIERHEYDVINSLRNSHNVPRQMAFEVHVQNAYSKWGRPVSFQEWTQLWKTLDELAYGVLYLEVNLHTVCCAEYVVKKR